MTIGALLRTALQLLEEKNDRNRSTAVEECSDASIAVNRLSHEVDLPRAATDHRSFGELTDSTSASESTGLQADAGLDLRILAAIGSRRSVRTAASS